MVIRGEDLVGDGVNVAARIQQDAEPDTICVSGVFFDNIRRNSPFHFDDLGERNFKNMAEPIHIYRLRGEMASHRMQSAPTRTKAVGEKRPSSVAVLPFRVTGGDEDQRFLAEGLTDELIVELARFRRLFVSSRSASFAVLDENPDPVRIGAALRVRYVLEGQIRKIGDQIRIGLTLTETENGSVVWSNKIVRPFAELLDLVDVTASQIAASVFGRMEDAGMIAARRQRPENMSAFECLLRGMDHHRLGGVLEENSREAIRWFTRAIELEPDYGTAYAWRVCASADLPDFSLVDSEPDIRRALELDPSDAEANRIMAVFELLKDNFERSATLIRRAMELNPVRRLHQGALRRHLHLHRRGRAIPQASGRGRSPRSPAPGLVHRGARHSLLCAGATQRGAGGPGQAGVPDLPLAPLPRRRADGARPPGGGSPIGEGGDGEPAEPHHFGFHDEGALPRPHCPAPAAHPPAGGWIAFLIL